jgi:peptidyl-tRNA hydrolase, PTH1 family
MNESGRSAGEAARYFKIDPSRIVVFHDELDLPPGKVRVKTGGGNAGHNGLKSLTEHLGNEYRRVRIGIGHPGDKALVHNYVLSDFFKEDIPWLAALCDAIAAHAPLLAEGKNEAFQNKIHQAMEKAGFGKEASSADGS